ncbi:hypothetical protein BH24ACT26_BH24ACT26_19780 [soil metagenome]
MSGERDGGQALIETILVGLLLLVPLIWVLGVLADLHRSALAATAAVREAGFDAARSPTVSGAGRAVDLAVRRAFLDQGLDPGAARVRWDASGLARGEAVEIQVSYPVTVLQAPLLGRIAGPSVWVEARHAARIDPFRSRE